MDRDDGRHGYRQDFDSQDTYDTRQAKQRASIKWLLSKAYNNRVPENLREPFYKDHENQEHVKPQIVHMLASAELYCLAFGNIYSDPNYHNLNHGGFLQTLSRKGIAIPESADGPITETVLIKTAPIKLSAHIAMIEAMMELYINEVVTSDRVTAAVQRFTHGTVSPPPPQTARDGLLLWVNQAQVALSRRIALEGGSEPPRLPSIRDVQALCDGAALAALVSFYCPEELPWNEIKIQALPTVSDCVHNLCLVHEFAHHSLPSSVCHMMPEDVTYLRGDMAINLLVMLADLFNVLEIHPVKCVRFPARDSSAERNSQGVAHRRSLPQPVTGIPDLRSHLTTANTSFTVSRNTGGATMRRSIPSPYSESTFAGSPDSLDTRYMEERDMARRGEDFVVHRNRTVPTLSSMIAEDPLLPARLRPNKEKGNQDSKTEERGEARDRAAGKPTSYEEARKPSYAGRRSRRNSLSEDSQLTLENFGGSQENLHLLGRNPDKDPAILLSAAAAQATRTSAQEARSTGVELIFAAGGDDDIEERSRSPAQRRDSRKSPSPATVTQPTPSVPLRSSREDARSNAIDRIFADNGYGLEKTDAEKPAVRELSRELSREPLKETQQSNLVSLNHLLSHSKQGDMLDGDISGMVNSTAAVNRTNGDKMTSFACSSPNATNTTTWQMQQKTLSPVSSPTTHQVPNLTDDTNSSAILNIRMKLEEKRRLIESEKKRTELTMNKKRQQMGKAAFLQAVTKKHVKPNDEKASVEKFGNSLCGDGSQSQKDMREANTQRWMEGCVPLAEEPKTPDSDHVDLEHFQRSIAQMDTNLQQMDVDMQKLGLNDTYLTTEERLNQQFNEFASQQQKKIANLVNQQQKLQSFAMQIAANQSLQNRTSSPVAMSPLQHRTSSPVAMLPPSLHRTASPVNQTYTTFASSPPTKPISLSQLHLQSTANSPSPGQFFLHEQQPRRTTWREQSSEQTPNTWREPEPIATNAWRDREARESADRSQTTWRDEPSQGFTLHEPRMNGSGPTPSPRSAAASPLHSRSLMGKPAVPSLSSKPVVPPRQTTPRQPPAPAPVSDHDMEPQSICFIGDEEDDKNRAHIQISSGSRTYRIPSPTRPYHAKNPFQQPVAEPDAEAEPEKGFYISFDNEAPPKRPKPPLRSKRNSPKKDRFATQVIEKPFEERDPYRTRDDSDILTRDAPSSVPFPSQSANDRRTAPANLSSGGGSDRRGGTYSSPSPSDRHVSPITYSPDAPTTRKHDPPSSLVYSPAVNASRTAEPLSPGVGLVIGTEENDPNAVDEMEKKKEKILLLSLQRRQHQEEVKSRKEMEAQQRKEMDKLKEEERSRKKEEDKARRAAILEQYKLKKAIEEAEREGKVVDKAELLKLAAPKMRSKPMTTPRPRPKTIHVESGAVESGMGSSRGQRGSSNNLAERSHENSVFNRPLRRDHYRGSQDSLAGTLPTRGRSRESPCDENGPSPSRASASNLGRRGSYKTSRDTSEPPRNRVRSQYNTYQSGGLRNQKSNSLVNLSGSSTDQDSMVYRYGDTDSGLGRATPPRRAPSPGFNRHLTSPSGPGSLPPGLISKRRGFDDGASDVSSASSMMDYNGPRLYKQPATKSNRGIMLNAVEYCVFPGVVNKDAKRRVLEEISRSEAKHFLILFRDAGCQFRALYSYCPDSDEVFKLYGTGPKQVNENMFDRFFKYNSGGKCFAQIHTKHLTVTIDAFTIHNSLWQGKKVQLPSKKDMALVI